MMMMMCHRMKWTDPKKVVSQILKEMLQRYDLSHCRQQYFFIRNVSVLFLVFEREMLIISPHELLSLQRNRVSMADPLTLIFMLFLRERVRRTAASSSLTFKPLYRTIFPTYSRLPHIYSPMDQESSIVVTALYSVQIRLGQDEGKRVSRALYLLHPHRFRI